MKNNIVLQLFLVCSILLCVAEAANNTLQLSPNYWISWTITGDSIKISGTLTKYAWAGLGWHCIQPICASDMGMKQTDFAVATFEAGALLSVDDMWSSPIAGGFTSPADDIDLGGVNNILSFSGSQTQTPPLSTFNFTRALVTTDKYDWPIVKGYMRLVWAHGNLDSEPNDLMYHSIYRGETVVDFFQ